MGTWGTGLFSDDTACDVRDEYRDLIAAGASGEEATTLLLDSWKEILDDPDAGPVFWLALAVTQWKIGRLEESVKDKALVIIASGADLKRWEVDPKLLRKRVRVLDKIKEQITSPQREPLKIRRPYVNVSPFQVGDAFTYQLASGNLLLFRVVDLHSDRGGTAPIVEICDWLGLEPPSRWKAQKLRARIPTQPWQAELFLLYMRIDKDYPAQRVKLIGRNYMVKRRKRSAAAIPWTYLDQALADFYGIQ